MYKGLGYQNQKKIKVNVTKQDVVSRYKNEFLSKYRKQHVSVAV